MNESPAIVHGIGPKAALKDASNRPGATTATLALNNVTRLDAGTYSVIITNAISGLQSSNAVVHVVVPERLSEPVLLAGGGMKVGQVIGATDRHAAAVVSRPVHFQDVFATLYRNLGIDPGTTTVTDPNGRPQHLLEHGQPIRELV